MDEKPREPNRVIAVAARSLFLEGVLVPMKAEEEHQYHLAHGWQQLGVSALHAEFIGTRQQVTRGRISEILSRVAAAGEQFMLATAARRDGRRYETGWGDDLGSQLTSRALIEVSNYYLLSTSHGLANATLRALLLDFTARQSLQECHPRAKDFEPFGKERAAWISCDSGDVRKMRLATRHAVPAAARLVRPLTDLLGSAAWVRLLDRRAVDFHRHRPQSVSGGGPVENAWRRSEDGQQFSLSFGINNSPVPIPVMDLYTESRDAAIALTTAMDRWIKSLGDVFEATLGQRVLPEES